MLGLMGTLQMYELGPPDYPPQLREIPKPADKL